MFEQAILHGQFQALLEKELEAERVYGQMLTKVTDPGLREQIEQLQRAKRRHVRLTERLLEIVE